MIVFINLNTPIHSYGLPTYAIKTCPKEIEIYTDQEMIRIVLDNDIVKEFGREKVKSININFNEEYDDGVK